MLLWVHLPPVANHLMAPGVTPPATLHGSLSNDGHPKYLQLPIGVQVYISLQSLYLLKNLSSPN